MIGLCTRSGRPHRTPPFSLVSNVKRGRKGHISPVQPWRMKSSTWIGVPTWCSCCMWVQCLPLGKTLHSAIFPFHQLPSFLPFGTYILVLAINQSVHITWGARSSTPKIWSCFFGVHYHLSNNMKSWKTNVEIKDGCFWVCSLSSVHTP